MSLKKPASFTLKKRITAAKSKEFEIISNYNLGYRNREDITKLSPGILVIGSQNVLTSVDGGISIRKGYVLDGAGADLNFLLQQDGFYLLQQDGSFIIVT